MSSGRTLPGDGYHRAIGAGYHSHAADSGTVTFSSASAIEHQLIMGIFTRTISEDDLEDLHGKVAIVTGGK